MGYLVGSVPFGIVLTRLTGAGDLRQIGSGNTGATNVLRTGRKGLAALTLLLDLLKGVVAVIVARAFWPGSEDLAAAAAVIGHCYPVWIGFRGGKGVATMMGVVTGLALVLGGIFALVWLVVLAITRISSLGGLSAALSAPLAALALGHVEYVPALAGIALLVFWRHRENIARLMRGEEPRVGARK